MHRPFPPKIRECAIYTKEKKNIVCLYHFCQNNNLSLISPYRPIAMRYFLERIPPADRGKKRVPHIDNRVISYRIALFSAHRAGSHFASRHFPPKIKKETEYAPLKINYYQLKIKKEKSSPANRKNKFSLFSPHRAGARSTNRLFPPERNKFITL